jgi:hypothetical protein
MLMFATGTGTKRNLAGMRANGWGLLLTPDRPELLTGFAAVAIDNGAWGAHQCGEEWTPDKFCKLVDKHGAIAHWVVAPDIVCGGLESLARSVQWLPWLLDRCRRVLIAVQDGITATDLMPLVNDRVGIFVGGSTNWKIETLPMWGELAKNSGCYLHVGRVNSAKRIRLCAMSGADSVDGTSGTRFAVTIPPLSVACSQAALELFA